MCSAFGLNIDECVLCGTWLNHGHTAWLLSIEVIAYRYRLLLMESLGVGFPRLHCLYTARAVDISDGAIACSWSLGYHSVNN